MDKVLERDLPSLCNIRRVKCINCWSISSRILHQWYSYIRECDIIRNLKKAGGKEQELKIKEIFFAKYAERPALRDELSRV